MPQLHIACAEGASTRQQVVAPHAVEALAELFGKARPGVFETLVPGHQCPVVIGAEVVQIFHHEASLAGMADLSDGGQLAVGEDVLVDPRVGAVSGLVASDGVQHEEPIGRQAALGHSHVGVVVFLSDVFKHAQADDAVKALAQASVVHEAKGHRQALAQLAAQRRLLGRDGHARAADAVAFGGVLHEAAPAAANVEHMHARLQAQLLADEFQLVLLGFVQVAGAFPEGAGVGHATVEHGRVKCIAQVVMLMPNLPGAVFGLQVQPASPQMMPGSTEAAHA